MDACKKYKVSGIVQGVGFRYYTLQRANSLGLKGWVRNLINGDVELVACGTNAQLNELTEWLNKGPAMARVHKVEVVEVEPAENYAAFSIR